MYNTLAVSCDIYFMFDDSLAQCIHLVGTYNNILYLFHICIETTLLL